MKSTLRVSAAFVVLIGVASSAALRAHNTVRATLVIRPEVPRVRDVWRLSALLDSSDGLPHPGRRVTVTADMTVHQMRPIEAEMTRVDTRGRSFAGQLSFTMPGPWRIVVRSDDVSEQLVGTFSLEVGNEDDSRGAAESRILLDLMPPPQPNLIAPAWVVTATIALVIASEVVVTRYQRRRSM